MKARVAKSRATVDILAACFRPFSAGSQAAHVRGA